MSLSRRSRSILIFWAAVALIAALEAVLTAAWLVRASASELYTSVRDIPAREIGMADVVGSVADGKYADFVICDDALRIKAVYIGGELV